MGGSDIVDLHLMNMYETEHVPVCHIETTKCIPNSSASCLWSSFRASCLTLEIKEFRCYEPKLEDRYRHSMWRLSGQRVASSPGPDFSDLGTRRRSNFQNGDGTSEKAGSCREYSGQLWLEPPVFCH